MKSHSSLFVLAALGVLSPASAMAADVDTSEWKCGTCPYPKGTTGSVTVGAGTVTQASNRFGDETGLQRKGGFGILGGSVDSHGAAGGYANAQAEDLGLDTRRIAGQAGQEGLYQVDFGYGELPRWLSNGAATPFLGVGGAVLTLPAGYPAPSTDTMPLGSTLQPVDIGFKLKRYDLGGSLIGSDPWSFRVDLHRDQRDGTRMTSGSFFSSAAQLVAPVDERTDRLVVSASYAGRQLQATLGYEFSQFRNGNASLTWSNPFIPVVAGATKGQLALAPDNDFQQLTASAGYTITPKVRASVNLAAGRLTQNAAFLAPTLNASLFPALPALAAPSLDGRIDTFDGSVRLSAAVRPDLQLTASYARDVRDNRTPVRAYTIVATDMFIDTPIRSNTPFTLKQDRLKLAADYRASPGVKLSAGADENDIERSYQEVVKTRETTVWGRGTWQARDDLSLALRLAHADRSHSTYGTSTWIGQPDNPLLRKFNLAARKRDSGSLRADIAAGEKVNIGLNVDVANDDYTDTDIGLTSDRSVSFGGDVSVAITEQTQFHLFAQGERTRYQQAGSQAYALPDWSGLTRDAVDAVGLGLKHRAMNGKLEIGADLVFTRSRNDVSIDNGATNPPFPTTTTSLDSLKLNATYQLNDKLSLLGRYWYEHYSSQDWRLDGVLPGTVGNLLAFGDQAPKYNVNVIGVALRYRF